MIQASRRRRKPHLLLGVCFKGFGLILKGSSHRAEKIVLLTLQTGLALLVFSL